MQSKPAIRIEKYVTPARLTYDRVIGTSHLYQARKVLAVPMRASKEKDEESAE